MYSKTFVYTFIALYAICVIALILTLLFHKNTRSLIFIKLTEADKKNPFFKKSQQLSSAALYCITISFFLLCLEDTPYIVAFFLSLSAIALGIASITAYHKYTDSRE